MEVRTETKVVSVTLTMDQQEAEWLMAVMQNPFCSDCGQESKDTYRMRQTFFYALKGNVEEKYEEAEEKHEVTKRELKPCKCGSHPDNLVCVSLLPCEWSRLGETGKYEHFVQCQTCKARGLPVYSNSSLTPPETLDRWGLK